MKDDPQSQVALERKIMNRVFGDAVSLDPAEFRERFIDEFRLPRPVTSSLSGQTTWTSLEEDGLFIDQTEVITEAGKHDWLYPAETITSEEQFMELLQRFNFAQAGRTYDASDIFGSDDVSRSHHVYNSVNVIESSNITDCSWIWESEYLFGCARSGQSTFSVCLIEGVKCSDSYKVYSSHNIVKSMFIKNSYDLTDCLFCAHLQHKQYCIANMQYDKETYFKLKKQILSWVFSGARDKPTM